MAGAVLVAIFGLPFLIFGVFFASKMASAGKTGGMPAIFGVAFGLFFACIGAGLIALSIFGYRKSRQQEAKVLQNPGAPWLWRDDWAAGRSDGKGIGASISLWVFTIFWNAISIPAAVLSWPKLVAGDLKLLMVLLFPTVGVILTIAAVIGTLRAKRFGKTSFWFASLPLVPGRALSGFIHLKMPIQATHGIDVRLSCVRRVTTGSGKNRSTVDTVLWQDEKNVPGELMNRAFTEAQVPVDFAIPAEAPVTNTENPDDKVLWILHAQADVPGVDFKDDYELPVFRTGNQSSLVTETSSWVDSGAGNRTATATAPAYQTAVEPVTVPAKTHITITEDGATTTVYFPPLRNPGQTFVFFLFVAVWTGVVYLLLTRDAPWLFRIVFGGADLLLSCVLLNLVFGSCTVRVAEGTMSIRKAFIGIGSIKTIPLDGVQSITPVSLGQADASGEARFGVFVRLVDGQLFKIAANTLSRTEARWIVAALDRASGRKDETQPQFQPFSMLTANQKGGVVRVGGVSTNKIARAVAIVFVLVWVFTVGKFFVRFSSSASARRTQTQPVGAPEPAISGAPMTDEDEARIVAMPAQQQAEELLQRSIRHDERALKLLQERVDGWTSNLHLTDRMKRLEEQSRYSTDLRVRQANEDIELALDGWHKDQDAVDLLIQRASNDPGYKPAALYFLGMEGGRGIDTQRVHGVLREHALHDSDEKGRLWAVEGLRFLETDEALDTLWEAFTSDASFAVRNRAGCNISDCGVFRREQRMRFVPKLIAVAGDVSQNQQMRTWCFMALREITGASLPDGSRAWNQWYVEHGQETLEDFQRQPWYQVRGDQ